LEAKIFSSDGHEGRKYYYQMQEELYLAWPELLAVVDAAKAIGWHPEEDMYHALVALEEDV
jgi:hypothetical protein